MNSGVLPLKTRRKVILALPVVGLATTASGECGWALTRAADCVGHRKSAARRRALMKDCFYEEMRCAGECLTLRRAEPLGIRLQAKPLRRATRHEHLASAED